MAQVKKESKGYYSEKIRAKFNDALKQAMEDYKLNPEMYHVTISNANSKMGAVASVSLLPFVTCPAICAKTCGPKCYAAKLANLRPAVLRSYAMNTAILFLDPEKYWKEVNLAVCAVRYFRFHVSGDITNTAYAEKMIDVANANPHTEILTFTKRFDAVNAVADRIPGNLHIMFSGWTNLIPNNPHNLPETNVIEKGAEPRDNWKVCGGNCFNCACRGVGCWNAGKGDVVAFPIH